jgi:hypothetical protein
MPREGHRNYSSSIRMALFVISIILVAAALITLAVDVALDH